MAVLLNAGGKENNINNGFRSMVKAHYTKLKLVAQSPFLESKFSDFSKKHLNGVEVHIFFHFQVHTTII